MRISQNDQLKLDREKLRKLGYIQELDRSLGVFSNFALSFAIISILTGLITLYGFNVMEKGAYGFWAWIVVGIFQLFMALSLGEIASCYPIAGGVYQWTNILGNNQLGWFNGWISLIGWSACTTGINYGLAKFISELFNLNTSITALLLICLIIVALQSFLNFRGIKGVAKLNHLSVVIHIVGVLTIFVLLLIFSEPHVDWQVVSFERAVKDFRLEYFIPALMMGAWTLTAFDASASISEECINPTKTVPYGMILSVFFSIIGGAMILFSFAQNISVLGDLQGTGSRVSLKIITMILGPNLASLISIILVAAMFICGLAAQTVTVRIIYAFSRNNGLPFSEIWKKVSQKNNSPIFSIILCGSIELILSLTVTVIAWDPSSKTIPPNSLPIITSLSTAGLYTSYAIVMVMALIRRKKINKEKGDFSLGKLGPAVNLIALLWAASIASITIFVYNTFVALVFLIIMVLLAVYYFVYMRTVLKYNAKKLSEGELLIIENMRGIE
jgi:Amino acid transporters